MRKLLLLAVLAVAPPPSPVLACARPQRAGPKEGGGRIEELVAGGRRLLAQHRPKEAEELFLQAEELEGGSIRTRMWTLRAWMDQGGRSNDTLGAIDALGALGNAGPDMDYLYGMAFARRAEEQIAAGIRTAVQMNVEDAIAFLKRATAADGERFRDAFLPLARAAWYGRDLGLARAAASEATLRFPEDPEARFMLGRVALSLFSATQEGDVSASERHWETARGAFERAVELCGEPSDPRGRSLLAQSQLQLGHTYMWKNRAKEARSAYARALAWGPETVDCTELFGVLGNDGLLEVLEWAVPAFSEQYGEEDDRNAAMLWWLGYTRFYARKRAQSEEAFLAALEKSPEAANSWHYVALARYDRKDYGGTIAAIRRGWDTDPVAMVAELEGDVERSVPKMEYLVGWCAERDRFADAALLSELCAEAVRFDARFWNNLGFFLREEGARLGTSKDEAESQRAGAVFEESLRAYRRAVDLAPEDPTYWNDAAVILHYYLDSDLEQALEMYGKALRLAEARLAQDDLASDLREVLETVRRDATDNTERLTRTLERLRKEAQQRKEKEGADGKGE